MSNFRGWGILVPLGLCLLWACQKEISVDEPASQTNNPTSSSLSNTRLSYGDTLFYLKNQQGTYTISPVSKPAAAGYFKANPYGLIIDSLTGKINITASETGLRYKIYYISNAGQPLDSVKLVISGIDYTDSIYRIQATPTAYDTAFPIYNARPELQLPCGDDDEDDDGDIDDDDNLCVFDETDLNDDGNDDIPGVIQDKLLVDIKKGTIDAEASFHAGVFGSSNPANGLTRDFTFYYRLADASNRALNRITVRLYHYRTLSDIPQWLLDEIKRRKNTAAMVNSRISLFNMSGNDQPENFTGRFTDLFGPKRPPIIVIVSQ